MLSKSKYCAFVQCPRNLWLQIHDPDAAKEDRNLDSKLSQGNEIGDLAMQLFGDFTEVTAYKADGRLDLTEMIKRTARLMAEGCEVICEASFSYGGSYCAVDILRRMGDGYAIYEVKSSTNPSDIYYTDIAYQKYVLEHCGVKVTGCYLICINKTYVFDGSLKLDQLFKIIDVASEVSERIGAVKDNIALAEDIIALDEEPVCDLFLGCHKPYDCPFFDHCSSHLPSPSVFDLYSINFEYAAKCVKEGRAALTDILDDDKITKNAIRRLQIDHALADLGTHIDKKGIREFLSTLKYPLYFLDFESVQLPIPRYVGTKPYAQIPFQYSLHYIETEGGELMHKEFLAEDINSDPLRPLAEALCLDIPTDGCVIVYNKTFESGRLNELAGYFPDLGDHLLAIRDNIVDLVIPFRKGYYYNRNMGGSFSIKSVLPATFPGDPSLDYHNLDGVQNGDDAMNAFPHLHEMTPEQRERTRHSLLKYCELDTYAMVKLWDELCRAAK